MVRSNKKLLIIWDFDGVIADSEKLWVKVWCDLLKKEKNITLTKDEKLKLLVGVANRTKKHNLMKYFPHIKIDENFMKQIIANEIAIGSKFMEPIEGVEEVLKDSHFAHCIATGATHEQQMWKMTKFKWLNKYIKTKNHFTVDMVEHGKPAPDLFLLAAKTMGYDPQNCIVIEDSLHGMHAAKAAGMKCIAFLGAEGNNTLAYRKKSIQTGADYICMTMSETHHVLKEILK